MTDFITSIWAVFVFGLIFFILLIAGIITLIVSLADYKTKNKKQNKRRIE